MSGFSDGLIANDIAQSFRFALAGISCPNGSISSVTIFSSAPNSNVTLSIYSGDGFSDPEPYTQSIAVSIGANKIDLDQAYNFVGGNFYTIRFTSDNTFQLAKNDLSGLFEGQYYENGMVVSNQDLFFIVNTGETILPVELSGFTVKELDGAVLVEWQTASELNNEGFEIQHCVDGWTWSAKAFVPGSGTTNQLQRYSWKDIQPEQGQNYYRLKQIDYDGASEFSGLQMVEILASIDFSDVQIYPNPVISGHTLTLSSLPEGLQRLDLISKEGRALISHSLEEQLNHEVTIPNWLPKGLYYLLFTTGKGEVFTEKLAIN